MIVGKNGVGKTAILDAAAVSVSTFLLGIDGGVSRSILKDNARYEKFTLKSREYKYGDKYYLVLADANDEKNILQQYEFIIDIAFVDDFGF